MSLILSGTNGLSDVDGSAATPAIRGTDTNTGVFFPAADTVGISTGGTERARVDSSGNLGLGVTPSAWSTSFSEKAIQFSDKSALSADTNTLSLSQNAYQSSAGTWKYLASSAYALRYDANNSTGVHAWYNAPSGTAGNAITFTQAMTLDSSGNLLVGTTSNYGKLTSFSATASAQTASLANNPSDNNFNIGFRNGVTGSSSGTEIGRLNCTYSGTDIGWISFERSGGAGLANIKVVNTSAGVYLSSGSGSWGSLSDERLKTSLTPFENAAAKVATLRAGTGRYLTDDESVSRSFLIAQDVQAVLPEAVNVQDDEIGTLGLQYTDVIPLLVAAIKEQQALITQLQADIELLKGKA